MGIAQSLGPAPFTSHGGRTRDRGVLITCVGECLWQKARGADAAEGIRAVGAGIQPALFQKEL